jgi:hypothetical protein
MAASRQKRPVANRVKIFLLFSQKRTRRQISHVRKVPKAEVIPTRGVAKRRLCDILGMALLSHVSSSSPPSELRPNVISDVANDLCHRSDLCLDWCRRAPWPHSRLTTRPVRYYAQRSRLDVGNRHANLEFVEL